MVLSTVFWTQRHVREVPMRRGAYPVALAAALALMAALSAEQGIDWRTDVDAALREAEASGRPLFVVFRCEP